VPPIGVIRTRRLLAGRFRGVDTTPVQGRADVRSFFDRCALSGFDEQHGDARRLLEYRLGLIRVHGRLRANDVVLDVGCGNGHHLVALAPEIGRGIGVDLSPGMIDLARARLRGSAGAERVRFAVDDALTLAGVETSSVDLALCVGALEHMLEQDVVLRTVHRVLRPGGRFFCLTPDGAHPWYRGLAPLLGLATKHLSTDRFFGRRDLQRRLALAGFRQVDLGSWTFIPRGDMPPLAGALFQTLGSLGVPGLRGGLWACAWKG
jgi:SAM-dependent methyltransferase